MNLSKRKINMDTNIEMSVSKTMPKSEPSSAANKTTHRSVDTLQNYKKNSGSQIPGQTPQQLAEYFDQWADKYEEDLRAGGYIGPEVACRYVKEYCPDRDAKVLDVAAGTGMLGNLLKEAGYTAIDGLDASAAMLDMARRKEVYRQLYQGWVGPQPNQQIPDDSYDAVVIVGSFSEGNIPCSGLNEIIRVTKPGGVVINVMREEFLETCLELRGRLEPYMSELQEAGCWSHLCRSTEPQYAFGLPGLVHVYRVNVTSFPHVQSVVLAG